MKSTLCLALAAFCVGCEISREHAISIASREVGRRGLSLPVNYKVSAGRGRADLEPGYVDLWDVTFSNAHGKMLYVVSVDRYSRQIQDFLDPRDYRPANVSLEQWRRKRERMQ